MYKRQAFLVSANYDAILAYNNADAYALAVAQLSDLTARRPGIKGPWDETQRALCQVETAGLQTALTGLGFDTQGADGFIGPNTTRAVETFQIGHGLVPDGHADTSLYQSVLAASRG